MAERAQGTQYAPFCGASPKIESKLNHKSPWLLMRLSAGLFVFLSHTPTDVSCGEAWGRGVWQLNQRPWGSLLPPVAHTEVTALQKPSHKQLPLEPRETAAGDGYGPWVVLIEFQSLSAGVFRFYTLFL